MEHELGNLGLGFSSGIGDTIFLKRESGHVTTNLSFYVEFYTYIHLYIVIRESGVLRFKSFKLKIYFSGDPTMFNFSLRYTKLLELLGSSWTSK